MTMRVLSFFSRYFGLLKSVPLFPQAFDGALLLWTLLTRPEILDWMDHIRREVATWHGISIRIHRFGGVEFCRENREIGHIHGNGVLDLRLSSTIRDRLLDSGMAFTHHTFPRSTWISFPLARVGDEESAINLLKLAYSARTEAYDILGA